jgi:hypothetical protein
MVKLYEKASFALYSMEMKCKLLRCSTSYSYSLLNDLASAHCLMIQSASEVKHLYIVFHSITQIPDNIQFWYSSIKFYYILATPLCTTGTAG